MNTSSSARTLAVGVALAATVGFGLGTAFSAAGSTPTGDTSTGVTYEHSIPQRVGSADRSDSPGALPGDVRQAEERNAATGIRRSLVSTP
ncbi:MAG TPA: hypothetical protein VH915_04620 [Pedococcus sp.]